MLKSIFVHLIPGKRMVCSKKLKTALKTKKEQRAEIHLTTVLAEMPGYFIYYNLQKRR